MEIEEMSKEEQVFGILCRTVENLRSKKEYDIIESLYNDLVKYNLIHTIEDFKNGLLMKGSMEEALIYWIWRALVQNSNDTIVRTVEDYNELFRGSNDLDSPF